MAESVIGRGVIEVVADARKLKAGIDEARRSIRTLGEGQRDISKNAQQSIDKYIGRLQAHNATLKLSVRETELYKLALRGASNEQLKAADSALRLTESHEKAERAGKRLRGGIAALGAIAVTGLIAAAVLADRLIKQAGNFQDMAEKIGDTAEAIASLSVAAQVGGTSMEELTAFSIKLTKNLTGVDDESKAAGAAIKALGLDIETFKALKPADQMEALAKALAKFGEGKGKTAVLEALAKGGAQLLPFLRELAGETGRQNILTAEQIRLADQYADAQKRLRAEIGLHAQAIATGFLKSYNDMTATFLELIKGIDGVRDGIKTLGDNTAIEAFAERTVRALATVVDYVQVLARGLQIAGRLIAANAAFHMSILSGEFKQAVRIYELAAQDIKDIATQPLFSTKLDERIANRKAKDYDEPNFRRSETPLAELKFKGPRKTGTGSGSSPADTARREAADKLASDLANIKRWSAETTNALANAEKIMQAMRAEGLVNDQDYYASKLAFIQLNSQAQEAALQQELSRLERETFVGKNAAKDQIENQRKIADLHATLANNARDTTTAIEQNSIAQKGALDRVAAAYLDAKEAAQAYLDTIKRQNKREIEGVGRGQKFRDRQAALGDIEDRRIESKRGLKSDLDRNQIDQAKYAENLAAIDNYYNTEVALYEDRTATLTQLQADGNSGMLEGMRNFYDEAQNLSKSTEQIMSQGLDGLTDQLTEFVTTGKADFKGLADSIIKELTRAFIRKQLANLAMSFFGGFGGAGTGATVQSSAGGYAEGGQIRGAGSGTSDSIPVLLSNKEFVVRAKPVQEPGALAFLTNFNKMGMKSLQRFSTGGLVGAMAGTPSQSMVAAPSVVINQNFAPGTDTRTINQAATAAGRVMQRAMRRNV